MGLFKGSKTGRRHDEKDSDTSSQPDSSTSTKIPKTDQEVYGPPPGPPPWHARQSASSPDPTPHLETFPPPPGPPPSQTHDTTDYLPPPGPPPDYAGTVAGDPAPNNAWMAVPDTALLPPPPSGHEQGSNSNATLDVADRAHQWCRVHPLVKPHKPSQTQWAAVQNGDVRLMKPPEYCGDLLMPSTGTWRGSTRAGASDACLISSAPLYFASVDAPTQVGQKKTVYYEIEIKSLGQGRKDDECSIAIGYCAVPYPTWRMPGWERGSLAIHSDDGRRYVNDTWGGKDFTMPVKAGETVGLGVTFTLADRLPGYDASSISTAEMDAEIFFTRNGRRDGGWNLHEELDEDQGLDGLDGAFDLYAAVGVFGGAEFDIKFKREGWYWLPR